MTRDGVGGAPVWRRVVRHIPAILVTLLVALYAVDVPYWDTWDWLDRLYPDVAQGPATSDLALFNGHRVTIPLAIDRALFAASSIDVLPRIWLKIPLSLATLWLLVRLLRRTAPAPPGTLVQSGIAAFVFTLAYWPMWMDPRQYSIHIVVLALVAAVDIVTGRGTGTARAAAAAGLCLVASLSYGPGLFTWPFVLVLLWVRVPRPPPTVLALLLAVAMTTIGLHLADASGAAPFAPTAPPSVEAVVHGIAAVAGLPAALASPSLGYRATRVMGVVGLALFAALTAFALRRPWRARALPWIAIGGWAATYAVAVGLARGGLALPSMHEPRFAYGGAFLWVAITALLHVTATADAANGQPVSRRRAGAMQAAACLLAAGCLMASVSPFTASGGIGALHAQLVAGRACLMHIDTAEDSCLERLYPSAVRLRAIALRMERRGAAFLPSPSSESGNTKPDERAPVQ